MKKLKPVDIHIDTCMDADDVGQRLVDCVRAIDADHKVVNIVKIHVGDIPVEQFNQIIQHHIAKPLKRMGADNCIFVPIKKGVIEDITMDHIEVVKDETVD